MTKVVVFNRAGEQFALEVPPKGSFMDVLRDTGFDQLEAMCGGSRSCATCHVYVDPAFSDLLPPITEDEHELLDGSAHRTPASRLACQIRLQEGLDGIAVHYRTGGLGLTQSTQPARQRARLSPPPNDSATLALCGWVASTMTAPFPAE